MVKEVEMTDDEKKKAEDEAKAKAEKEKAEVKEAELTDKQKTLPPALQKAIKDKEEKEAVKEETEEEKAKREAEEKAKAEKEKEAVKSESEDKEEDEKDEDEKEKEAVKSESKIKLPKIKKEETDEDEKEDEENEDEKEMKSESEESEDDEENEDEKEIKSESEESEDDEEKIKEKNAKKPDEVKMNESSGHISEDFYEYKWTGSVTGPDKKVHGWTIPVHKKEAESGDISDATLASRVKRYNTHLSKDALKAVIDADGQDGTYFGHKVYCNGELEIRGANESVKNESVKVDVSADVEALLKGETLSEDFKAKAKVIFENVVINRVKDEIARISNELKTENVKNMSVIKESLIEKVDGYLSYVVEQWVLQNEIALESGIKTEILEDFVSGLRNLFEDHYIEVPNERFDVLSDLQDKLNTTKKNLDEATTANAKITKAFNDLRKNEIISVASKDLVSTDAEKLKSLAEELTFEDDASFERKVQTIRDNYFSAVSATQNSTKTIVDTIVTDEPIVINESAKITDVKIAAYAELLTRSKK